MMRISGRSSGNPESGAGGKRLFSWNVMVKNKKSANTGGWNIFSSKEQQNAYRRCERWWCQVFFQSCLRFMVLKFGLMGFWLENRYGMGIPMIFLPWNLEIRAMVVELIFRFLLYFLVGTFCIEHSSHLEPICKFTNLSFWEDHEEKHILHLQYSFERERCWYLCRYLWVPSPFALAG